MGRHHHHRVATTKAARRALPWWRRWWANDWWWLAGFTLGIVTGLLLLWAGFLLWITGRLADAFQWLPWL